MANRKTTLKLKRSNVSGKIPTLGQLELGELALNTADVKAYAEYTGGGTGATEVRQIGWDRLSTESGGTVNGDVIINGDLTVTGTTNFSGGSINPIDYIQFDITYTGGTPTEGRLYWDPNNNTLTLGHSGGEVAQQIGQELYYLVKNQSGATIENGRVVRATGTLGASGRILAEYMIADGTIPQKFTLGVATEDILNGEDGFVTEFGLVRGIDTTGSPYGETWNDGDVLWVSPNTPGGLTNIQPSHPDLNIEIALVVYANVNGSIFVRPKRYPHFHDLQEASWTGGTENNLDIIQWNSSISGFTLTSSPTLNTLSANTINATTFSGGTFYGDGSGLTGITATITGTTSREIFLGDKEFTLNNAGSATLTTTSTGFISFAGVGGIDDAGVSFRIPQDYNSNPEFSVEWSMDGSSSNQVRYALNITTGNTLTELDLHTTVNETIQILDNGYVGTSWRILQTPYSGSSITYTPGTYVHVEIERDPGNVNDTLAVTSYVSGLIFRYVGNKGE